MLIRLMRWFSTFSKWAIGFLGYAVIGVIGITDFFTGSEISISIFYALPVFVHTWTLGRAGGLAAGLVSVLVEFFANLETSRFALPELPDLWNAAVRFAFLAFFVFLLEAIQQRLERESRMAKTDFLTAAENRRSFYAIAESELSRARRYRHPVCLAYFDLDHFKEMNDRFGHEMGDKVLVRVAGVIQGQLRDTDRLARLGGDEFAVLFPEIGPAQAHRAVSRIHKALTEAMRAEQWPVTFSIGEASWLTAPDTVDELIGQADRLMYGIKKGGRNGISSQTFGEPGEEGPRPGRRR